MKCYYCESELQDAESPEAWIAQECHKHLYVIIHRFGILTKGVLRVIFYLNINDDDYEVVLKPAEARSEINVIVTFPPINRDNKPFRLTSNIKYFDYVIHITPENAVDKIKTILTFS